MRRASADASGRFPGRLGGCCSWPRRSRPAIRCCSGGQRACLGVRREAATAAQDDGLLSVGTRVLFHHPLVRSAVYQASAQEERRAAHRALAEATDLANDPDRRAWHRALAAAGPDEEVAAELERSADRARARGGIAAAAAFLERSTILTPEAGRRTRRALAAAQARQQAGAFNAALALVAAAEARPLDEFQRAQATLVRGQIAFATSHWPDAPPLLLAAAKQFEPLDPRLSRDTYLWAMTAAMIAAGPASEGGVLDVATAVRQAPPALPPYPRDLLLDGIATLVTEGYTAGADVLKRAITAYRNDHVPDADAWHWVVIAGDAAAVIWDDESWRALTARCAQLTRELGALSMLPLALSMSANERLFAGDLTETEALAEEAQDISTAIGSRQPTYGAIALAAWRGSEAEAAPLIAAGTKYLTDQGEGSALPFIRWVTAVLYNGLGRYEEALGPAGCGDEYPPDNRFSNWLLPELIEAAARCGQADRAARALGTAHRGHPRLRDGLGAGHRGLRAGAAERRRSRGAAVPGGDRGALTGPASGRRRPGPGWSTGNGCAGSAAGPTRATSCAAPTRRLPRSAWKHSPSAHGLNSRRRANAHAGERRDHGTS